MQGIGFLGELDARITSLKSGPHKGAAHGEGRAVDADQFGGVTVGVNEPTIRAIAAIVKSGKFSRIGTLLPLVKAIGPWAWNNYRVQMFEDDDRTGATGPHVHLEVHP